MRTRFARVLVIGVAILSFAAGEAAAEPITQIIDSAGAGGEAILDGPHSLATDALGNVYVTGFQSDNAFKITPGGGIEEIIDSSGDRQGHVLVAARGIAVDAVGNVFVVGYLSNNVFKITPNGTITQIIDSDGAGPGLTLAGPRSVAVDSVGNVYVTASDSNNAFKITREGEVSQIIDSSGDGFGNMLIDPEGIAVDALLNVYVCGAASDNAFMITPDGTVTEIVDAAGDDVTPLDDPEDIAVDLLGNVFLPGRSKLSNAAFKITPSAEVSVVMNHGDGLSGPTGVTVDCFGNLYVVANLTSRAFRVEPGGMIAEIIDSNGDGMGNSYADPFDIAVDGMGNVFVAGFGTNNVFRIEGANQDCNANGIPDECDIAGGANQDCNGNGIPDECDIDAGDPDGNGLVSDECNGNDVPDECEIDENSGAGGPFYCTADCDPDCNDNGIPDECDITSCPLDFANPEDCDDCNLNGVPDGCDIAAMTSQDTDLDRVPDECTDFDGEGEDQNWSTADNWDDNTVPGNGDNVTIDANIVAARRTAPVGQTFVTLDIPVTIDSLRLLNGATLDVLGTDDQNLTIATGDGILITAEPGFGTSLLRIANDRRIDVEFGSFIIDSGGLYEALDPNDETTLATLAVDEVGIISRCPDDAGGDMQLSGMMQVRTSGDFVLDASRDCLPCSSGGGVAGSRSRRGGKTRPILRVVHAAAVNVGGNFVLMEGATIDYGSAVSLVVGGSFDNQSTCPDFFNWAFGGISFDDAESRSFPQGPGGQFFEVGGHDFGPSYAGFASNFAVGEVEVASERSVRFVDTFDNDRQGQTAPEALYVETLRVGVGATVEVDNCSVYYRRIIPPAAESDVVLMGAARFEKLPPTPFSSPVTATPPHDILKNRYISIDPRGADAVNVGQDLDIRVTLTSTLVNGVTAVGSQWWANSPDTECIAVVGQTRPAVPPNWDACPTLHLTGCPIIPTSTFDIVVVDGALVSEPPLARDTQAKPGIKWHGDCVGSFTGTEWMAPNGQTNIDDAVAAIKTFQNPTFLPGCGSPPCNATHASVTDVAPNLVPAVPNKIVNIEDVLIIILGFGGQEYPGPAIELCPDP